tara:strand:- start:527 stop:1075 length:549 start_codon:yes stop_codon:yes gene_type:complete
MMIQPGMALALANDCSVKCASAYVCDGCGCCQVASPEQKCSCCDGGEPAAAEKTCCMGEAESDSAADSSVEMTQSDEILELQVITISTAEPSVAADSDVAMSGEIADVELTSTCRCGVESSPLGESAPARPTLPIRDSVAIRHSELDDLFGGPLLPQRPSSVRSEDFMRPHFSQIQLCIWRL